MLKVRKSKGRVGKFPLIGFDYQLRGVDDLYIAGGASHGPDFRKSAGGFLHGFRYTGERSIRAAIATRKLHDEYCSLLSISNATLSFTLTMKPSNR